MSSNTPSPTATLVEQIPDDRRLESAQLSRSVLVEAQPKPRPVESLDQDEPQECAGDSHQADDAKAFLAQVSPVHRQQQKGHRLIGDLSERINPALSEEALTDRCRHETRSQKPTEPAGWLPAEVAP
jgi:hypothetical protein